jgi:hypothetical protein
VTHFYGLGARKRTPHTGKKNTVVFYQSHGLGFRHVQNTWTFEPSGHTPHTFFVPYKETSDDMGSSRLTHKFSDYQEFRAIDTYSLPWT